MLGASLSTSSSSSANVSSSGPFLPTQLPSVVPAPMDMAVWDHDKLAALNSMLVGVSLLTIICAGYLVNTNRIRHVPESAIAMVLGVVVGLLALSMDHFRGATEEQRVLMFSPDIFFYILLPPVVFEAGFSADRRIFVNNLSVILSFAVLGTFISTIVVAEGLYAFGFSDKLECYLFGSLISATDPVATIALFGSPRFTNANSDATFHCLVFGESLLNDAVAIVLFAAFERSFRSTQKGVPDAASLMTDFLFVSFGSLMIGLGAGFLCAWCFRRAHPRLHQFPAYEVSSTFFVAYLSYAFAQYLDFSGISSVFFCGLVLSKYNWYNLSETARTSSKVSFRTLSIICESLVFCYLGVFATFSIATTPYHWNIPLIIASLFLIGLGRALHIFPLTKMLNCMRVETIPMDSQVMMWFSGLRGAVAFALALRLPSIGCTHAGNFVTTTIAIVGITTLVLGSALETIARRLGLIDNPAKNNLEPMIGYDTDLAAYDPDGSARGVGLTLSASQSLSSSLLTRSRVFPRGLSQRFASWDKRVLQQFFGGEYYGFPYEENIKATELQGDLVQEEEYIPCSSRSVIFE
eukprot:GEMP01042317.1.p1 GENE.GEMP01042317.1~~GEMP01042317.1.p1  ORF type:complete len:579 (+),score=85.57 GEMP01042317.1:90-1826(+)